MRLKEIDNKYKVRYDHHREKDRSSENTESLMDSYNPPKSNDNLDPLIHAEQTTLKSTLNIQIPDACCEHFETRSSTSDNNVSVRVTSVDNVSGLIMLKTQFSEGSEKSKFMNQSKRKPSTNESENSQSKIPKSKIPKDREPAQTINKSKNSDSYTEFEKSRSVTEIDEILDNDESISEILDPFSFSESISSPKSKTEQIAFKTKNLSTKSDEPLDSHSFSDEETLKSNGYSNDSFESDVSEKESSRQSQSQKSTTQVLVSKSDSENEKISSSSKIEASSTKSNEDLNKQKPVTDGDGEISNLFVPLTPGAQKIQVENEIHESPEISSKDSTVLRNSDLDQSMRKVEPSEIYNESSDKELSTPKDSLGSINNESSLERHSKTLRNGDGPAAHEESSTSLKSLGSGKLSLQAISKKLSISRIPNRLENKNNDLKSTSKETTVSHPNYEDSRNSLHSTKRLRKCKKEEFKISAISQNKIPTNPVKLRRKIHRGDELPMESEKKCCQAQSHLEIETKKDRLFSGNKKTSAGKRRLPLPEQLRQDRRAATTQSARVSAQVAHPGKIEFQDQHHRELRSLEEQFSNLRMEQDRETMLFYMRNFDEDQKRLLLWPSQLQTSRKPEIPIIKPLDFPEVANFNERGTIDIF